MTKTERGFMRSDNASREALRVGIVGAGTNTIERHIPGLRDIDGVEIVAVCNRTRASSERVAKSHDIAEIHEDWRSLVSASHIDAVVIGTWPNMHERITVHALEMGKHVLCEARMAMSLTEAMKMRDTARNAPHLTAQLVPSPLSFSVDATIRRMITEGFLGSLVAIEVEAKNGDFPDPTTPMHWRQDADLSGVNVMGLGIWYESLMRWVGEAVAVTAVGKVTIPMRADPHGRPRAVRVPDHLDVIAEMACGAQASLHFSTVSGISSGSHATLYGTEGVLSFDGSILAGARRGASALELIDIPPHEAGSWTVEKDFVDAIRHGSEVTLTDFETGVKYMQFTEAVWLSMQQRRTIPLSICPS